MLDIIASLFSFLSGAIFLINSDNNPVFIGLGIFFIILGIAILFTKNIEILVDNDEFEIDKKRYKIKDIINLEYSFIEKRKYFNVYYYLELYITLKDSQIVKKLSRKSDIKEALKLIKLFNKTIKIPYEEFYIKEYIIIIIFLALFFYFQIEWLNFVIIAIEFIFIFGFIKEIDRYIAYKMFLKAFK